MKSNGFVSHHHQSCIFLLLQFSTPCRRSYHFTSQAVSHFLHIGSNQVEPGYPASTNTRAIVIIMYENNSCLYSGQQGSSEESTNSGIKRMFNNDDDEENTDRTPMFMTDVTENTPSPTAVIHTIGKWVNVTLTLNRCMCNKESFKARNMH